MSASREPSPPAGDGDGEDDMDLDDNGSGGNVPGEENGNYDGNAQHVEADDPHQDNPDNDDDDGDAAADEPNNNQDRGQRGSGVEREPHEMNQAQDEDEEEEEEIEDDGDDSGSVPADILEESSVASDSEEDWQEPRSRRRSQKTLPKSAKCKNCEKLKNDWNEEVEKLEAERRESDRRFNARIRELEDEIQRLRARGSLPLGDPWQDRLGPLLEEYRNRGRRDNGLYRGYEKIYFDSCRQGNMSISSRVVHPNLFLEECAFEEAEISFHFHKQMILDRYGHLDYLPGVPWLIRHIILPFRYTRLRPLRLLENAPFQPFQFERLPVDVQRRIWAEIIPSCQLIHFLSRLDRYNPPLQFEPENLRFPNRFHIGDTLPAVAIADQPSRYLRYFHVSKRWYYATTYLFYATNTFAFSSLGEWGRFCECIGMARLQRLVNVELTWQGALSPKQEDQISIRKLPLQWFMHTPKLRTLVIHISESGKDHMRRAYEMRKQAEYYEDFTTDQDHEGNDRNEATMSLFAMESRRTGLQPNFRKNRSMRTVQGMDFIYQLRGMRWVKFYDLNNPGEEIRDSSFVEDVNNVTTRKKNPSAAFKAEVDNLLPLTALQEKIPEEPNADEEPGARHQAPFTPDDKMRELVESFYDDTLVDDVPEDVPEDASDTSSSGISGFSSDSGDSWDSSSGGSSGSSSSRSSSGTNGSAEVIDLDIEMEDNNSASGLSRDNNQQASDVDMSDAENGSGSRSRPNSGGHLNKRCRKTVPGSKYSVIVVDDNQNGDGDNDVRTDSGLFVPSGSCSARSNNISDRSNRSNGTGTTDRDLAGLIDLTLDDEDDDEVEEIENPSTQRRDDYNNGQDDESADGSGTTIKKEDSNSSNDSSTSRGTHIRGNSKRSREDDGLD
ncbi:hypothetical protein F4777DRAFT_111792 [Nemania sp. FL0916]|nr:hypothetical protein F4777DRAFT_111792 [Nemania sp. FL0916]